MALILGIIAAICTIYTTIIVLKSYFTPESEKIKSNNFYEGNLHPAKLNLDNSARKYTVSEIPPVFLKSPTVNKHNPLIKGIYAKNIDKYQEIKIVLGTSIIKCQVKDLYNGVDVFNPTLGKYTHSKLILGLKNDRLYVSVTFKDLQNEETIGIIDFNHWELYKVNTLDFNNDDYRLEVKDKQNYIVFSIDYREDTEPEPVVHVNGYFISPRDIVVLNNAKLSQSEADYVNMIDCFFKGMPNWKKNAENEIALIKSIF